MPETQQPENKQSMLPLMIFLPLLILGGAILLLINQEPSAASALGPWSVEARRALRAGQPTPPLPPEVAEKRTVIATSMPTSFLGVNTREILRCASISPGSGSSMNFAFPQLEQSALVYLGSSTGPLVTNPPPGQPLPDSAAPEKMAMEVKTFLASVNCGLTQPIPQLASETFLQHLSITPVPPTLLTNYQPAEVAKVLGPLFQSGKLPAEPGFRLPSGFLGFPSGSKGLPEAYGIAFEILKEVPPPIIAWENGFQARLASSPSMAPYAKIWRDRQVLLATWVPQLCDNVGYLLRSGALAFNRPDVLTASASRLSPMDEIQLLRALFHVGCYSSTLRWYPRPLTVASDSFDPFLAIPNGLVERFSSADELLKAVSTDVNKAFDRFLLLENGDITLESITASQTLWIGCLNGNVTLKGNFNAATTFIATKGGNLIVSGGRMPSLIALATPAADRNLQGGRIIVNGPVTFAGNIRCQSLEFANGSGESRFFPDFFPLESQLFLVSQPFRKTAR